MSVKPLVSRKSAGRVIAGLAGAMLLGGCLAYPPAPGAPRAYAPATLYANHVEDGEYFNPWRPFLPSKRRLLRFIFTANPYDKSRKPVIPFAGQATFGPLADGAATITWAGHATVLIREGDDVLVTDPNLSDRFRIFRRQTPAGIAAEQIPDTALGVISHAHHDHLDEDTVEALPANMHWFVPAGLGDWFRERGRNEVTELDWWESAAQGDWRLTCLPAQHWSRRGGIGFNRSLWCAWLIEHGERRYLFAGDTGYFHGFAEYGRLFGPVDVAILPIGAFEPRAFVSYQHMDPAQAWQAFLDLKARYLVPVHWGTFDITHEPLDLAPRELREAAAGAGGVRILAIGEEWSVPAAGAGP